MLTVQNFFTFFLQIGGNYSLFTFDIVDICGLCGSDNVGTL